MDFTKVYDYLLFDLCNLTYQVVSVGFHPEVLL